MTGDIYANALKSDLKGKFVILLHCMKHVTIFFWLPMFGILQLVYRSIPSHAINFCFLCVAKHDIERNSHRVLIAPCCLFTCSLFNHRSRKPRLTTVGIRRADHATPSVLKSWH
jgi:hypothetical protein